jgi:hypothetical protein
MICSERSLARPPAELVMNETKSSASSEQAPVYSADPVIGVNEALAVGRVGLAPQVRDVRFRFD